MEERLVRLISSAGGYAEEENQQDRGDTRAFRAEHGGKVRENRRSGARAAGWPYRVSKHREGFFLIHGPSQRAERIIKELERRLKVSDAVIKYQTVRLDEDLKAPTETRPHRERRASRRRARREQRRLLSSRFHPPPNKRQPVNGAGATLR